MRAGGNVDLESNRIVFQRVKASVRSRCCQFQASSDLQVGDHVADLAGIEPELRHGWMAGDDSFGERLLEIFDRIALMQRAERRGDL